MIVKGTCVRPIPQFRASGLSSFLRAFVAEMNFDCGMDNFFMHGQRIADVQGRSASGRG